MIFDLKKKGINSLTIPIQNLEPTFSILLRLIFCNQSHACWFLIMVSGNIYTDQNWLFILLSRFCIDDISYHSYGIEWMLLEIIIQIAQLCFENTILKKN